MYKMLACFTLILISTVCGGEIVDKEPISKNLELANTQIEILKAQVEVMKNYQDKFLSTVYWSLGGIFSIVILLVGYNWFTNFKSQERETQFLKDMILNEISTIKRDLLEKLNEDKEKLTNEIKQKLKVETNTEYQKIQSDLRSLKRELDYASISLLKLEHTKWLHKQNHYLTVKTTIKLLDIAYELSHEHEINNFLDQLIEDLKLFKSSLLVLNSERILNVTNCIKKFQEKHTQSCNTIEELLREIANR